MSNLDSINKKAPKITISSKPVNQASVSLLNLKQKKEPKRLLRKILVAIILVIIILGIAITIRAQNISDKIFVGKKTTFFSIINDVIRGGGNNDKLIGEDLGQINILLLGIGGEGHDGPYLTDTMILAQIRPDIGQMTLTSIPRDYLVTLPDKTEQKINSAFSYGFFSKNRDWDEGGRWARSTVEKISGLTIPYFAVLDFSGFEKAIDQVGGLDVIIENTFTDYTYPDNKLGYLPPITFKKGPDHLDGTRALQFARSRHAAGIEGSDFSRSLRQQKIIDAFKQKVLGGNIITSANNINQLLSVFANHFHTNILPNSMLRIINLTKNKGMQTLPLSLDPETGLVCPQILASNGAYVLVPCLSEESIKNYFKNSFAIGKLTEEQSIVWLANSTSDPQIYNTAFRKLTDAGIKVYQLGYSKDNLSTSIIFQANSKPATTEYIKNVLSATEVNIAPPGVTVSKDKVDVIVVLGKNAPKEQEPPRYIPPPARIPTTTTTTLESISTTTPTKTLTTSSTPATKLKK